MYNVKVFLLFSSLKICQLLRSASKSRRDRSFGSIVFKRGPIDDNVDKRSHITTTPIITTTAEKKKKRKKNNSKAEDNGERKF